MPHVFKYESTADPSKFVVTNQWFHVEQYHDSEVIQTLLAQGAVQVDSIPELLPEDRQPHTEYALYYDPTTKKLWYEGTAIITPEMELAAVKAENARLINELETEQLSNKTMTESFDGLVACLTEKGFI